MLTPEEEARKARLLEEIKELEEDARARFLEQASARTYTFADIKNPIFHKEILRFQNIFGAHFPYLLDDEHHTIVEHGWIQNSIFGNPTETVKKSGIDDEFKKLRKAIHTLADHPLGYWIYMPLRARLVGHEKADEAREIDSSIEIDDDDIGLYAREIFDLLLAVDEMREEGVLHKVLDRYEEWARDAISRTPDRRNINWDAVHAIYRLRVLWWRNTGQEAPRRALNPASPFADFLRDAFDFFDIQGDPISAFKRWSALVDKDASLR